MDVLDSFTAVSNVKYNVNKHRDTVLMAMIARSSPNESLSQTSASVHN